MKIGADILIGAAVLVAAAVPTPPPTDPPAFPSGVVVVELQSCTDLAAGEWRTVYTLLSTNDVCFYRVAVGQGE